jgi:hypothetical protein
MSVTRLASASSHDLILEGDNTRVDDGRVHRASWLSVRGLRNRVLASRPQSNWLDLEEDSINETGLHQGMEEPDAAGIPVNVWRAIRAPIHRLAQEGI